MITDHILDEIVKDGWFGWFPQTWSEETDSAVAELVELDLIENLYTSTLNDQNNDHYIFVAKGNPRKVPTNPDRYYP